MEYQHKLLEHYQQEIERQPYLCGGTQWNFIDFSSANRDESMPRINNKGLVYSDRTPKDVYYYFKASWRKDIPVLHIASRDWNFRSAVLNPDVAMLPVKIYTNLQEVELFVDGVSLGKKQTDNCNVSFDVPFSREETFLHVKGVWKGQLVEDAMNIHFTPIPATLNENNINGVELAVNVGSDCFYTSAESHLTWLPDQEYRPGSWGISVEKGMILPQKSYRPMMNRYIRLCELNWKTIALMFRMVTMKSNCCSPMSSVLVNGAFISWDGMTMLP